MPGKLVMYKGLPGCGKSTHALAMVRSQPGVYKRVNKDDLRAMIDASEWSSGNEKEVLAVRDSLVERWLKQGKVVLCDDTNLHPKHEARLRELAQAAGASFSVEDMTDVSVEVCIQRDLERTRSVGERVIRKFWKQFLFTPPPEPQPVPLEDGLPRAIIVDIDGTVAKMVARGPHDYGKVSTDAPRPQVIRMVRDWVNARLDDSKGTEWHLIFCSGRPDSCREDTENWIKSYVINHLGMMSCEWTLFMRSTYLPQRRDSDERLLKDHRNDAIVKREIYDRHIKGKYNVDFVLDDRNRVVDMWRANGLLCLQVAPGDF